MQMVRQGSSWSGNERNCVFLNCTKMSNSPRFANMSAVSGLDFPDDGRAVAIVDWDHDGDLDVWFRNRTAPRLRLMRNRSKELAGSYSSVGVRLIGTTSNRDAVGARVELVLDGTGDNRRLVQTVRAGSEFLSQSTKWIHFGLGDAVARKLIVDWPGGTREEFIGIEAAGRYKITQGSGQASMMGQRREISLRGQNLQPLTASAAARIVLPTKISMPTLVLARGDGSQHATFQPNSRPCLIVFWISSCPNCVAELTDLTKHQADLDAADVDVLAVCLDGLDASAGASESQMTAANEILKKISFPFDSTGTTVETIDLVRHFQNALFNKYPEFVVPLSFLTDSNGQVVSIYRGAISHDVVVQDQQLMHQSEEARRNLATPLTGSWITKPATPSQMAEFVARRIYARAPDEGLRYYESAMNLALDKNRKDQLGKRIVATRISLGVSLAKQGELSKAKHHFQEALQLEPNNPAARRNLELILQQGSP